MEFIRQLKGLIFLKEIAMFDDILSNSDKDTEKDFFFISNKDFFQIMKNAAKGAIAVDAGEYKESSDINIKFTATGITNVAY